MAATRRTLANLQKMIQKNEQNKDELESSGSSRSARNNDQKTSKTSAPIRTTAPSGPSGCGKGARSGTAPRSSKVTHSRRSKRNINETVKKESDSVEDEHCPASKLAKVSATSDEKPATIDFDAKGSDVQIMEISGTGKSEMIDATEDPDVESLILEAETQSKSERQESLLDGWKSMTKTDHTDISKKAASSGSQDGLNLEGVEAGDNDSEIKPDRSNSKSPEIVDENETPESTSASESKPPASITIETDDCKPGESSVKTEEDLAQEDDDGSVLDIAQQKPWMTQDILRLFEERDKLRKQSRDRSMTKAERAAIAAQAKEASTVAFKAARGARRRYEKQNGEAGEEDKETDEGEEEKVKPKKEKVPLKMFQRMRLIITPKDCYGVPKKQMTDMKEVIDVMQKEQSRLAQFERCQLAVFERDRKKMNSLLKEKNGALIVHWIARKGDLRLAWAFFPNTAATISAYEGLTKSWHNVDWVGRNSIGAFAEKFPVEQFLADSDTLASGAVLILENASYINCLTLAVLGIGSHTKDLKHLKEHYGDGKILMAENVGRYDRVVYISFANPTQAWLAFEKGNFVTPDGRILLVVYARMENEQGVDVDGGQEKDGDISLDDPEERETIVYDFDDDTVADEPEINSSMSRARQYDAKCDRLKRQIDSLKARDEAHRMISNAFFKIFDEYKGLDLSNVMQTIRDMQADISNCDQMQTEADYADREVKRMQTAVEGAHISNCDQMQTEADNAEREVKLMQTAVEGMKKKLEALNTESSELKAKKLQNEDLVAEIQKSCTAIVKDPWNITMDSSSPIYPVLSEIRQIQTRLNALADMAKKANTSPAQPPPHPSGAGWPKQPAATVSVSGSSSESGHVSSQNDAQMSPDILNKIEDTFRDYLKLPKLTPQARAAMSYTQRLQAICGLMKNFEAKLNSLKSEHEKAKEILPKVEQVMVEKDEKIAKLERALDNQKRGGRGGQYR